MTGMRWTAMGWAGKAWTGKAWTWAGLLAAGVLGMSVAPVNAGDPGPTSSSVELGRRIFFHNFGLPGTWDSSTPLGDGGDGLGPQFNSFSCAACHKDGGVGGAGPIEDNALILSLIPPDSRKESVLNPILKQAAGLHHEITATQVSAPLHRFGLPVAGDQRSYEEHLAELFDQLRFDPANPAPVRGQIGVASFEITQRNTTALWGVGLIDELRRREGNGIRRRVMEEMNAKYKWLSGRVPRDADQQESWFGWRGQLASLHEFNLGACATEMGLTVPGVEQHASPVAARTHLSPRLDLTVSQVEALTSFVASLPAPTPVLPSDPAAAARVEMGAEVFHRCHCNACHVQNLGFVENIYSDLLLHDMGHRLCDSSGAIPELLPGELILSGLNPPTGRYHGPPGNLFVPPRVKETNCGCEWRTPPLWGCADTAPYLHDGRASTLKEAILWHGGEANVSRQAYEALPNVERAQLIAFLETLRAPGATPAQNSPPQLARTSVNLSRRSSTPAASTSVVPVASSALAAETILENAEPPGNPARAAAVAQPPALESISVPQRDYAVLAELLQELTPSQVNLPRARQLRDRLEGEGLPSGLADYAYGLFQRQALKHQDSLSSFAKASRSSSGVALRARWAILYEDLKRNDPNASLTALERLATDTVAADGLTARERWDVLELIGRALGWMHGPGATSPAAASEAVSERLQSRLEGEHRQALDAGLAAVASQFAQLSTERASLVSVEAERLDARRGELAEKEASLATLQEEVAQGLSETRNRVETELKKIDEELQELERQYINHDKAERQLTQALEPLQLRLQGILLQEALQDPRTRRPPSRQDTEAIGGLNDQVNLLTRRREEHRAAARVVGLKAERLTEQRRLLQQQVLQTAGAAAEQSDSLAKWQKRVARQSESVEESSAERSRRVQLLERRIKDLSTYVPFDARSEARQLLAGYQPAE